jgi:hypothetical protein
MSNDKNKPITPFVSGQLPEFVRIDHPTLVAFLSSYYEWLDSDESGFRSAKKLANATDVDNTLEEFVQRFKNEYLLDFPEKLAISERTKKPVDAMKLLKNIKGFYNAKGTEKTYDFLFRILFDTGVEFYYPKNDILKLSDGKWILSRSLKITNNLGNIIFDSVGKTIYQKDQEGNIIASARVLDASVYRIGTNDVAELFLGNINGEFVSGYNGIEFEDLKGIIRKENRVFSVLGKIQISNGGSGYRVGDKVIITPAENDTGLKASARVSEVDISGRVRKIVINNFGINYKTPPSVTIESEFGKNFSATTTISGISEYQGYYANNDGRLSTSKVIQDNHYYQNYSYLILTEITIDRYRDILKRLLNPAGLAFFGKVQLKKCSVASLENSSSLISYEIPIIGNYAPYTLLTYDDLAPWFTNTNTGLIAGYDPVVHDSLLIGSLDLNGDGIFGSGDIPKMNELGIDPYKAHKLLGNPVTYERNFINPISALTTTSFENSIPFWIVYQHPNRKVRESVVARIPYDLKNDFLNDIGGFRLMATADYINLPSNFTGHNSGATGYWPEWSEGSTSTRENWATGFTSGERYVVLNYNPTTHVTRNIGGQTTTGEEIQYSEFRKMTINSFLKIPVGVEFDCRQEEKLAPQVPQFIVTKVNSTNVNSPSWSLDPQYFVTGLTGISRGMQITIEDVKSSSGVSTILNTGYYGAVSTWCDLYISNLSGEEYKMASIGPISLSTRIININYPFINPEYPQSEPGVVNLGVGVLGIPFKYNGTNITNNNCFYKVKIYLINSQNKVITGSETIKTFNYVIPTLTS